MRMYFNVRALKAVTKKQVGCISVLAEETETFDKLNSIGHVETYEELYNAVKSLGYDCNWKEYHSGKQVKIFVE